MLNPTLFESQITIPQNCTLILLSVCYDSVVKDYSVSLLTLVTHLFHCMSYNVPLYPPSVPCYVLSLLHRTPIFPVTLTVLLCSLLDSRYPYVPFQNSTVTRYPNVRCYSHDIPLCSLLDFSTVPRYPYIPCYPLPLFQSLLPLFPTMLMFIGRLVFKVTVIQSLTLKNVIKNLLFKFLGTNFQPAIRLYFRFVGRPFPREGRNEK